MARLAWGLLRGYNIENTYLLPQWGYTNGARTYWKELLMKEVERLKKWKGEDEVIQRLLIQEALLLLRLESKRANGLPLNPQGLCCWGCWSSKGCVPCRKQAPVFPLVLQEPHSDLNKGCFFMTWANCDIKFSEKRQNLCDDDNYHFWEIIHLGILYTSSHLTKQ